MVMMVFLVFVHLESFLRMRLVMEHHHLAVRILVRVPALHVALLVGHLVALLRVLVVAGREAELVTVGSMNALRGVRRSQVRYIHALEQETEVDRRIQLTCSWY